MRGDRHNQSEEFRPLRGRKVGLKSMFEEYSTRFLGLQLFFELNISDMEGDIVELV